MNVVEQITGISEAEKRLTFIPTIHTKGIPICEVADQSTALSENLSTQTYLRRRTEDLVKWQKVAYEWATQNPGSIRVVDVKVPEWGNLDRVWTIGKHGDYVVFCAEDTNGAPQIMGISA